MKTERKNTREISRRKFISTVGLVAGASGMSAIFPLMTSAKKIDSHTALKLGLLLPNSTIYPRMGANLNAGMQLYFNHFAEGKSGRQVEIIVEEIGVSPRRAVQKARKLIDESRVEMLAGLIDPAVCSDLGTVCEENNTFLVASQVGADIQRAHDHNPFIIHNSLGYWQSNWAIGNWAAKNIGKRALVTASLFESGYDALYAFNLGFERGGGQVVQTRIDNHESDSINAADLYSAIHRYKPDLIFAGYHGQASIDLIRNFRQSAFAGKIPLLASGFMMDDPAIVSLGSEAAGIKSCLPWSAVSDQSESIHFRSEFRKQFGYEADIFAVLGFDTAHLISNALDASAGHPRNISQMQNAFAAAQFDRQSGPLNRESGTPEIPYTLFLRESESVDGKLHNRVVGRLYPDKKIKQDIQLTQATVKTGFLNPYLCA